jgi:predicted MFS family arabinose efflux permease
MRIKTHPMNRSERRAVIGLAGIFALRMLGIFLILPVFAIYAQTLVGQTELLIGVALGVYGLTQALFQIPLGMASDRFGRKPIIALGLLVFAAGSVLAALSGTIGGVILGRAIQGAGGIAAATLALTADLTRDEQRTKAMAVIGVTIGSSFILALPLGSVLGSALGVPGIFWLTAVAAIVATGVLYYWVPTPVAAASQHVTSRAEFWLVLRDPRLLRLYIGIFMLHSVLMALFVVSPTALVQYAGLPSAEHWQLYVSVLIVSVIVMVPFIVLAERKQLMREIFSGAVLVLVLSQLTLYFGFHGLVGLVSGLFLFFVGFNFLEASLPSLISRTAPVANKGAAMGVYSTFQFLGVFVGGVGGGALYGAWGMGAVFIFTATLLAIWLVLALTMQSPPRLSTRTITVGCQPAAEAQTLARRLGAIPGVAEAIVVADEGVAYLKVDEKIFEPDALDDYSVTA